MSVDYSEFFHDMKSFGVCVLTAGALLLAGCGASGSDVNSPLVAEPSIPAPPVAPRIAAYVSGTPEGALAPSLEQVLLLSPYDGQQTDAPIVLADPDDADVVAAFTGHQPVVLLEASESEVNELLRRLGLPENFQLSDGLAPNRQYADVFAIDTEPNGDNATLTIYPPSGEDPPEDQLARVQEVVQWLEEDGHRDSGDGPAQNFTQQQGGNKDLRSLAQAQIVRQVYMHEGAVFEITYTVYACHSFDSGDGVGFDWFFVQQNGMINMARAWKGVRRNGIDGTARTIANPEQDLAGLYLGSVFFDNHFVGYDNAGPAVALLRNSPENANLVTQVTTAVDYSFVGSVGFDGGAPGVTAGVNISSSESFNVTDCRVTNNSASRNTNAEWSYDFKPAKGVRYIYYAGLEEPPALSTKNFQPKQEWLWRTSPALRDDPRGQAFLTTFRVTAIQSEGGSISNIPFVGQGPFQVSFDFPNWVGHVPLRYPPLIISSQNLSFAAAGGFQPMDLAVSRAWQASSDQPWCTVNPEAGSPGNPRVFVTTERNESGADRFANITFQTSDGKGKSTTRVFQSRL